MPLHGNNSVNRDFRSVQRDFAARIRFPYEEPCEVPRESPAASAIDDIEPRRLQIYQDLFFNNIESLLAASFPVLRSLYDEAAWVALVRQFMHRHTCSSPYFLQIGSEFLDFLEHEFVSGVNDPIFIGELAHYEWVELALDVSDAELPQDADESKSVLEARLTVSPLAWPLVYQYPVHRINAQFRPDAPSDEPTCLLVYRNRADIVQFIETNPITVHLLQRLLQRGGNEAELTVGDMLQQMAIEWGYGSGRGFVAFGGAILESFRKLGIVAVR